MPKNRPVFAIRPGCRLVLASTSPRRIQLLENLGIAFSTFAPDADEPMPAPLENPGQFSLRCAKAKNRACPESGAAVLSADTIVAINREILGKPANEQDALRMLRILNGNTHTVYTSFCLRLPDGRMLDRICQANVTFQNWPESVLISYALSGEPLDKAGAYAVQGHGVFLVSSINGSWTTVVGLPMAEVTDAFLEAGIISVCQ